MIQPQAIDPIPSETVRVAHAAFPKGNLYMTMRYEIGTFYNDQDFEALFPHLGVGFYTFAHDYFKVTFGARFKIVGTNISAIHSQCQG
ncbi:hypothetical protein [Nostoc sp. MS1]|uniref:hypothetical protein n=1 Tax=Nostoc sp. MS1 TaxID=2764711 RepID=UPI003089ED5F|nr:hypothetical protein NSMS1_67350 [Nostoc sp. MS1]